MRPRCDDLFFEKPEALVERYLRFELTERISASGEVLTPLLESELWALKAALEKEAVESVAVLHPPRLCLPPTRKRCR